MERTADESSPARTLLAWYDAHRRELPWRRDADPYRVWVSEIMLQQTRVDVVVPYYECFLERFPDVAALAAAEVDEVLALWSGLGYYRRARQMHAAARQVVTRHDGRFPSTLEGLRSLPGIGPYTAAAVGSIAFGLAEPVMDGNVERVTARLVGEEGDPKTRAVRRELESVAAELLVSGRPGDGNQALMELGATLCTPRSPRCLICPLRQPVPCVAARRGDPERYPAAKKRRAVERQRRLVALARRDGRVLLFRRPDDSTLMAGLWELPWVELPAAERPAETGLAGELARRYGGTWQLGEELGTVKHGITHRAIELRVHQARVSAGGVLADGGPEAGWFGAEERRELGLSSMVTKVLALGGP